MQSILALIACLLAFVFQKSEHFSNLFSLLFFSVSIKVLDRCSVCPVGPAINKNLVQNSSSNASCDRNICFLLYQAILWLVEEDDDDGGGEQDLSRDSDYEEDLFNNLLIFSSSSSGHYRLQPMISSKLLAAQGGMSKSSFAAATLLALTGVPEPLEAAKSGRPVSLQPPEFGALVRQLLGNNSNSCSSLAEVRSILEFILWGPSPEFKATNVHFMRENLGQVFVRWLHLERAAVLNGIVSSEGGLRTVTLDLWAKAQLRFLVTTDAAKMEMASRWMEDFENGCYDANTNL